MRRGQKCGLSVSRYENKVTSVYFHIFGLILDSEIFIYTQNRVRQSMLLFLEIIDQKYIPSSEIF
jgi:hypothetical protein